MKFTCITALALATVLFSSCGASKKSTTTPTPPPAATTPTPFLKPPSGIYAPRAEELAAIRVQYPDVTLEQLRQGHILYAETSCVKCHVAQYIYKYDEIQWKTIMDNMAEKARLTAAEKDAVYKYVLAIKAAKATESH